MTVRGTKTYNSWRGAKERATNPNHIGANIYFAKGVRMCSGFQSYKYFLGVMGERPIGMSLDRVDGDGNYSCGDCCECLEKGWVMNVRWATRVQQNRNSTHNHFVEFRGRKLCITELAHEVGIAASVLMDRINRMKWSAERAATTPLMKIYKPGSRRKKAA